MMRRHLCTKPVRVWGEAPDEKSPDRRVPGLIAPLKRGKQLGENATQNLIRDTLTDPFGGLSG